MNKSPIFEQLEPRLLLSAVPEISEFYSDPADPIVGKTVEILVEADIGGDGTETISKVFFYEDVNQDGSVDSGDDLLGVDTTDESGTWSLEYDAKLMTVPQTVAFLAVAQSAQGRDSDTASLSLDFHQEDVVLSPVIDNLTPSSTVINPDQVIQLEADITPGDNPVEKTYFYHQLADQSLQLIGIDTDGSDGWGINWDTWNISPGTVTIVAKAQDSSQRQSDPVETSVRINVKPEVNPPTSSVFVSSEETTGVNIFDDLTITDTDDSILREAELILYADRDHHTIDYTPVHGITSTYRPLPDSDFAMWIFQGDATPAQYQQAIRSVQYRHDASVLEADLSLEVRVSDGTAWSRSVTTNVSVNEGLPVTLNENNRWSTTYTDTDGDKVTVRISGVKKGSGVEAELLFSADPVADTPVELMSISFNGDTTNRMSLSISSRGQTTVGDINLGTGSLKSISGKTLDLTGSITGTGSVDIIQLDDFLDGASITLAGYTPKGVTIKADEIGDVSMNFGASFVKSLIASTWADGSLNASYLSALSVKGNSRAQLAGNLGAHLILSGMDNKGVAIGKLIISDTFSGGITTTSVASLGKITLGSWYSSTGLETAWINSIAIKGNKKTGLAGDLNVDITLTGGDPKKGVALNKLTVVNQVNANLTAENGSLGSVTVGQWAGGGISADWIKTLSIKGNKQTGLTGDLSAALAFDSFDRKGFSIGKLSLTGSMTSTTLTSAGSISSISMGGLFDSDIQVEQSIKSFSLKGWKIAKGQTAPAFTFGSTIEADYIKKISLQNQDLTNPTQVKVPTLNSPDIPVGSVSYRDSNNGLGRASWKQGNPLDISPWGDINLFFLEV